MQPAQFSPAVSLCVERDNLSLRDLVLALPLSQHTELRHLPGRVALVCELQRRGVFAEENGTFVPLVTLQLVHGSNVADFPPYF